jgi:hypothetical protein
MKVSLSRTGSSAFRFRFASQISGSTARSASNDASSASEGRAMRAESDSRSTSPSSARR